MLNEKSEVALEAFLALTGNLAVDKDEKAVMGGMMALAERISRWVVPLAGEVSEELARRVNLSPEEVDSVEEEITKWMQETMGPWRGL